MTIVWSRCWRRSRGAGPLVGCQLRCGVGLVRGVGAQAWRPSAGTTSGGALACTGACRVSRPGVECRTVLGGVVHRVGDEARYGYRLLETFENRHAGTSFRAANRAGETAGRGRQGRNGDTEGCIRRTGGTRNRACRLRRWRPALESWAEQEFGGAPLGDARLSARLATCARHQAEAPAFTGAAKGGQGLLPFHRQAGAVTVENILQPHQTLRAGGENGAVRAGRQFVELREAGEKGWGLPTRPAPRPAVCTCTPR